MEKLVGLTLEQQFEVCQFDSQVDQMSLEQSRDFLKKLYRLNLNQKNMFKSVLKGEYEISNFYFEGLNNGNL